MRSPVQAKRLIVASNAAVEEKDIVSVKWEGSGRFQNLVVGMTTAAKMDELRRTGAWMGRTGLKVAFWAENKKTDGMNALPTSQKW